MTPEQRKIEEEQIRNNFSELQKKLENLKTEIQSETNDAEKQKKQEEIKKMEQDLADMKSKIDILSSLQEQEVLALKTRLEEYRAYKQEILDIRKVTPTTYELLKDSQTCNRLLNIISSNPKEFANIPGDTPEAKLEYMFSKIRNSIVLFMKNKLGNSDKTEYVINNTIAPAFEWNLIELLKDQGNEENVGMLQRMDEISRGSFDGLVSGVGNFAQKAKGSYDEFNQWFKKFDQWINAIDYLSVHNGVLREPNHSKVLSNPLEFQDYMNNDVFAPKDEKGEIIAFSPYSEIDGNIFKIDKDQDFKFGISMKEDNHQQGKKSDEEIILERIGDIQVVNNPKTTSLITRMLDKPEQFLQKAEGLQQTANELLDGVSSLNSVTKMFGVDILGEITKSPEKRSFWYKILDFVCKLIGITGGLEGMVKKRRLDRLKLTDEKNENISQIFKEYQKLAGTGTDISVTDANSCVSALADFALTDLDKPSTTKGDQLRDAMAQNMKVNLLHVGVVKEILGDTYLIKEAEGTQQERWVVDSSKFTEEDKKKLAHQHIINMKNHLGNYNDLKDFYENINNTDDLAICMTTALYADKGDVIEGIKAKVFLPENYGSVRSDGTVAENQGNSGVDNITLSELTSNENSEMKTLVEQSKTPNKINYLENATYKKYLNIIERDLKLPRYTLESVCKKESQGRLYSGNNILTSPQGAKGLFQFMPKTASASMKESKLKEKCGKTFNSSDEFLKDPLATAWAAGIILSNFMYKDKYNIQSALACYNGGQGNYQKRTGGTGNLTESNFGKLGGETKTYVENITKNIMQRNSISGNNFLTVDLGKYLWSEGGTKAPENNNEFLIGPKLQAKNKDEIGGLGNSIMNGFQGLNAKTNFPNMDGAIGKNTRNHPAVKDLSDEQIKQKFKQYKSDHPKVKSFMFYFGANNNNNQQTISDIKKRSEWLQEDGIQPVLCTCVGENSEKTPWLKELNQKLIALGKEKSRPVVDFAKSYNKGDIILSSDGVHPKSYQSMVDIINGVLQA